MESIGVDVNGETAEGEELFDQLRRAILQCCTPTVLVDARAICRAIRSRRVVLINLNFKTIHNHLHEGLREPDGWKLRRRRRITTKHCIAGERKVSQKTENEKRVETSGKLWKRMRCDRCRSSQSSWLSLEFLALCDESIESSTAQVSSQRNEQTHR